MARILFFFVLPAGYRIVMELKCVLVLWRMKRSFYSLPFKNVYFIIQMNIMNI